MLPETQCCLKPNVSSPHAKSVTAPSTVLSGRKRSTCGAILEGIALLTRAAEFDWADAELSAPLRTKIFRWGPLRRSGLEIEEFQFNCIAHCFISGVVWVQMVSMLHPKQ